MSATGGCASCHPSCTGCTTPGICDACAAGAAATELADGTACVCNSGTGYDSSVSIYHQSCSTCHGSCETCERGSNFGYCTSCVADGATLYSLSSLGTCLCLEGYVFQGSPTSPCVACVPAGCPYCLGPNKEECMSWEEFNFVYLAMTAYGLPFLTETEDHFICFNEEIPTSGCTPDPIETVTGPIIDYTGVAKPNILQCYTLLTAQWPYATYVFSQLFPNFEGPDNYSSPNLLQLKSALYLHILRFGYFEMRSWTDLKSAMNDAGANWKNHIAWLGTSPGFSLDSGLTRKDFPVLFLERLTASCGTVTETCAILNHLFNNASKVCGDSSCSATAKGYCAEIKPSSACATS